MGANTRGSLHVNYRRLLSSFNKNCDLSTPADVTLDGKELKRSGIVTHRSTGLDGLTLHTRSLHTYIYTYQRFYTSVHKIFIYCDVKITHRSVGTVRLIKFVLKAPSDFSLVF